MTDLPRLIEHAFPLKQASLDSVHEKNVRHGHISTLHIWPARRPLAACRAALIATLLPDPGDPAKRRELCEKIGGRVVRKVEKRRMPDGQTVERIKEETEGGILHWGRETENAETLEWFRQEIRKAYGGRPPKVLDPFAGGGAIPLEAMRLGCEATAVDINPVAWFILKCTLEYPHKLAGQTRPLPAFILENEQFMRAFRKAHGLGEPGGLFDAETGGDGDSLTRGRGDQEVAASPTRRVAASAAAPEADLAWHVRAWGQWVLDRARRELAAYYPTYADFEPIRKEHIAYEHQPMRLVPLGDDGTPDIDSLNAEFTAEYLADKRNPRWVAKPTVAYLWARTVTCKNCRATVPLLKTRWLCKKANKRVLLAMAVVAADAASGGPGGRAGAHVRFGIQSIVAASGADAAQRRERDKRIGAGTMSRAGAQCPCCAAINTMEDIRLEGRAGRLGSVMTAVVVDGCDGKEYRRPTEHELAVATPDEERVRAAFKDVPFGVPEEPTPSAEALGMRVPLYGFDKWRKLFTARQLTALGTFVAATRAAGDEMGGVRYPIEWAEAVGAYLAAMLDRIANQTSALSRWNQGGENIEGTFARFALPILWDFADTNPLAPTSGAYPSALEWVSLVASHVLLVALGSPSPRPMRQSAIERIHGEFDAIVTDPPYYDAIPYSDLMDYFHIWLRRTLNGMSPAIDAAFVEPLSPKWGNDGNDGELIDDSSRHGHDAAKSKQVYEDGMARVFLQCACALRSTGRLVIVFAHKHPDAWETLVSAIIRAGFVVDGSWPIQTERGTRMRAQSAAALASSVWLVCKKRSTTVPPGWDHNVLAEMRANIAAKLREFWDAGIRGPDFVWAATGPALEAYSRHPAVRKANAPGELMGVGEFLGHVRRMVVDYVVGQVLSMDAEDMATPGRGDAEIPASPRPRIPASGSSAPLGNLDNVTAYYLLHRHDFGMDDAPVGACILYATACDLSDAELAKTWDILSRSGSDAEREEADEEEDGDGDVEDAGGGDSRGSGSTVKLKAWQQRRGKSMGHEAPAGKAVPLIDRIHRLMHLWKEGDLAKVDEYLDGHALRPNELFRRVVQSLIELAPPRSGGGERSLLESISNHVGAKGAVKDRGPVFADEAGDWTTSQEQPRPGRAEAEAP